MVQIRKKFSIAATRDYARAQIDQGYNYCQEKWENLAIPAIAASVTAALVASVALLSNHNPTPAFWMFLVVFASCKFGQRLNMSDLSDDGQSFKQYGNLPIVRPALLTAAAYYGAEALTNKATAIGFTAVAGLAMFSKTLLRLRGMQQRWVAHRRGWQPFTPLPCGNLTSHPSAMLNP